MYDEFITQVARIVFEITERTIKHMWEHELVTGATTLQYGAWRDNHDAMVDSLTMAR